MRHARFFELVRLLNRMVLLVASTTMLLAPWLAGQVSSDALSLSREFREEPPANALYALARLAGHEVSHARVAGEVGFEEDTSLEDLRRAGEALGMRTGVIVVQPYDLMVLEPPYIVYDETPPEGYEAGEGGVFFVVYEHDAERHRYGVIDAQTGDVRWAGALELFGSTSGRVLVPTAEAEAAAAGGGFPWGWLLGGIALAGLAVVSYHAWRRRRRVIVRKDFGRR